VCERVHDCQFIVYIVAVENCLCNYPDHLSSRRFLPRCRCLSVGCGVLQITIFSRFSASAEEPFFALLRFGPTMLRDPRALSSFRAYFSTIRLGKLCSYLHTYVEVRDRSEHMSVFSPHAPAFAPLLRPAGFPVARRCLHCPRPPFTLPVTAAPLIGCSGTGYRPGAVSK